MSKASRRFYRTLLLGLAALGLLVWTAIDQFGISHREMVDLFMGTLFVAGGMILLAGLCVAFLVGLRKLLSRNDGK